MTFEEALEESYKLDHQGEMLYNALCRVPERGIGNRVLPPDVVRATPEWRQAYAEVQAHNKKLQAFDIFFANTFEKELATWALNKLTRTARRAALTQINTQ